MFGKNSNNWELEASSRIFSSKKRVIMLFLLTLPIFLFIISQAAGLLPDTIGGKHALMPSKVNDTMFFGSIFVGLIAGLITGVIGAGGGYILTPALMSFGVKGIMAVGTDQFHLFAKAIMGTTIHKKLGNVNIGLAVWFVLGSFIGVRFGGMVNRALYEFNPAMSDSVISLVYVVVLGSLGIVAIKDVMKKTDAKTEEKQTKFADIMQAIKLPPYVKFDNKQISFLPLAISGAIVGFVTAIMGVGGGFLTFPIFVYSFGVSTFTTVGTNILQVIFTTAFSSIFEYAIYGFVFYTIAIGMLLGSLVGVQIGALVTKVMKASQMKVFYALTVMAGFVNRLFALPKKLNDMGYIKVQANLLNVLDIVGTVIFFGIVGIFSLWILKEFFTKISQLRTGDKKLIVNSKKFYLGVTGLIAFFIVLVIGFTPNNLGKSTIMWADDTFNSLTKGSATSRLEKTAKEAEEMKNINLNVTLKGKNISEFETLLTKNEIPLNIVNGNAELAVNYSKISEKAIVDAKQYFDNKPDNIKAKYNMEPQKVIYLWNEIFKAINKTYISTDGKIANFAMEFNENILEPAYNFRGINPENIADTWLILTVLLVFYVIYTMWYGFAIMYMFEGIGIGGH